MSYFSFCGKGFRWVGVIGAVFLPMAVTEAAVVVYSFSGEFRGGALNGGSFELRATTDTNNPPNSTGSSGGLYSTDYIIAPVSLTISGTSSDDGTYFEPTVSSRILMNVVEPPSSPVGDLMGINAGFNLPSISGFRLDLTANFTPGSLTRFGSFIPLPEEISEGDAAMGVRIFPFNTGISVANGSVVTIPEPSSIFLLAISGMLLCARRR